VPHVVTALDMSSANVTLAKSAYPYTGMVLGFCENSVANALNQTSNLVKFESNFYDYSGDEYSFGTTENPPFIPQY
jgi:hypothetical protein